MLRLDVPETTPRSRSKFTRRKANFRGKRGEINLTISRRDRNRGAGNVLALTEGSVVGANVIAGGELCGEGGFPDPGRAQHADFVSGHSFVARVFLRLHAGKLRRGAETCAERKIKLQWRKIWLKLSVDHGTVSTDVEKREKRVHCAGAFLCGSFEGLRMYASTETTQRIRSEVYLCFLYFQLILSAGC